MNNIVLRQWSGLLILAYVTVRYLFDPFWRAVSPWSSYAFEALFVAGAYALFRGRVRWRVTPGESVAGFLPALVSGFCVYWLAVFSGVAVPFDLRDGETLLLLLFLAPVLEELVFRMALWESIRELWPNPAAVLILTTALFSLGHLMALWSVPFDYRSFVLYQSLYVILLGLWMGWRRQVTGALGAPLAIHFGFNLGFYLAFVSLG